MPIAAKQLTPYSIIIQIEFINMHKITDSGHNGTETK